VCYSGGTMSAEKDKRPAPERGVPEPPWRSPRHVAKGSRVPLSRDAIVDAGIAVLDEYGLDGLSMRRVAERLGAGAPSLYWHIRNKSELLQLISERLTADIVLPEPQPARWQEQLKDVARQMRAIAQRHRDGARITLGRLPLGPTVARFAEWLFDLLEPVGIPPRIIAGVGDLAALYVGAYTFEESLGLASPTGEELPPQAIVAMLRSYLVSLPVADFPHVHAFVDDLLGGDADERFEFGLDVIVRGIAAYATAGE